MTAKRSAKAGRNKGGPKSRGERPVKGAPPRAAMDPVDFQRAQLSELEQAFDAAFADRSWQAVAALSRQKQAAAERLFQLEEAAKEQADKGPKLTDEQLVHQKLIPKLRRLALPLKWEVYRFLAVELSQPLPDTGESEVA